MRSAKPSRRREPEPPVSPKPRAPGSTAGITTTDTPVRDPAIAEDIVNGYRRPDRVTYLDYRERMRDVCGGCGLRELDEQRKCRKCGKVKP